MKQATIVPDGKIFRLMLGDHELGNSKADVDARVHMHAINEALDEAFQEGKDSFTKALEALAERMSPAPQISGPRCKKCGAFTTYARVESHGLCMQCETDANRHSQSVTGL